MADNRCKYAPCWTDALGGQNYERMHVCRVEGSNVQPDKEKGYVAAPVEGGGKLDIFAGYAVMASYFKANGATITKDCWNHNSRDEVVKAMQWELVTPCWSDDAWKYPKSSQFNRCLFFAGHGNRCEYTDLRNKGQAASVQVGKDKGSMQLDDILEALAVAPDKWKQFKGKTGSDAWLHEWYGRSAWSGLLTIILDTCHSGAWIKDMMAKIENGDCNLRRIGENLEQSNSSSGHAYVQISFRVSSLSQEPSWYRVGSGGNYTNGLVNKLREQGGSEDGYGTRRLVEKYVDGSDVVWGTEQSAKQTDMAVDFRLGPEGRWRWWYPEDREGYMKW